MANCAGRAEFKRVYRARNLPRLETLFYPLSVCRSSIRFRLTRETNFCCRGHFRNWDEILGCNGEDFSERDLIIYIASFSILLRLNRIFFVSSHANLSNFPFRERIRRIGKSNALIPIVPREDSCFPEPVEHLV